MSVENAVKNQIKYTKDELDALGHLIKRDLDNTFYTKNGFLQWVSKNNDLELGRIFVRPEKRRKGAGTRLTNKLIKEAERQKVDGISVMTSVEKEQTFGKFLLSMGFEKQNDQYWYKKIK